MLLSRDLQPTLTWVRVPRFDLDGRAAPAVLLHLGHPLASHLVGVVGGAHGDLVLDDALAFQLLAAAAANRRHSEPLKLQSSNSDCVQHGVALWRGAGPVGGYWMFCHRPDIALQPAICGKAKYPDSDEHRACGEPRVLAGVQLEISLQNKNAQLEMQKSTVFKQYESLSCQ